MQPIAPRLNARAVWLGTMARAAAGNSCAIVTGARVAAMAAGWAASVPRPSRAPPHSVTSGVNMGCAATGFLPACLSVLLTMIDPVCFSGAIPWTAGLPVWLWPGG